MSRRLFVVVLLLGGRLLLAAADPPPPPKSLDPAEAARQGRALVADILAQTPTENLTNTGWLKIRDGKGKRTEFPVRFEILAGAAEWSSRYETLPATNGTSAEQLAVFHAGSQSNRYELSLDAGTNQRTLGPRTITPWMPFAGSDFWVADLGLDFFHWPEQRILKSELRRSRSCQVLESVNPQPAPAAYSRVVSWIDSETSAILQAQAYDAAGKLLKEFDPKKVKKVNGQWQLEEMEIDNFQTGSRTRIEFSFDQK